MKKILALLLAAMMIVSVLGSAVAESADAEATYTYNYALSTFPTDWNPHTYQTATDAEILDYICVGMYVFDYNETMDGYAIVPGTAVDFPEDVTAEYIGQYGLEEGDENRAWKITLRQDLKWDDGTAITAHDYEESYKRLLDPVAQNYRADTTYTGNLVIHNAENYLKSGQSVKQSNSTDGDAMDYAMADLVKGEDGTYTTPNGEAAYFGLTETYAWMGGSYSLTDYYDYGYIPDEGCWEILSAAADDDGYVPVTDDTIAALYSFTSSDTWGNETEDQLGYYVSYDKTYGETAWEDVGVFAVSDYELVYVIDKPLSGFYLYYSLTDSELVKIDLYDSLATVEDGVYTNTYGTSAETTASFGPYKLSAFQADKQYTLERNEYYFDLEGKYQTTAIVVDCVPETSTKLELFLQGQLDTYSLSKDDMETYSLSDYCYYYTGASTYAMTFNPDYDALVESQEAAGDNINKTIITLVEFRQAMSFALDRDAFCLATSPTNSAAFALMSTLIVSDPDEGTAYRTTDVAKQVLAEFWGVSEDYGEGKLYADIDEAIDSITGYNLEKAQELFNTAYDMAIEQGLMDEDDVIEITIGLPSASSSFYLNGYEFLVNNYTEAVKGTKLEGKLTFTKDDTIGNSFADALRNNQVDMLFGVGWSGSALDPYSLMEAYIAPSYQYDDCIDYTTVEMTITIDGVDYTASVYDWFDIMMGNEMEITAADGTTMMYSCGTADNDPETRLQILGTMEGTVLMNYTFIPIMDSSTASLKSQQIEFATEEYVFGMGFGGVEYYTYNYTDAEWDAYVAENGGELDYT